MLYEQFFATVLVVDDEPLVLQQLCELVRSLGFIDIRQAATCQQACRALETGQIDILVADIGLPDGDGRKLAGDALRANPDLKLILISGFPAHALMLSPELRDRAHLLEKPFDFQDLRALLTACTREPANRLHSSARP